MESNNKNNKAKVMLLGTYYFGNAGEHIINVDTEDIMTCKKQQEVKEVIEKLIRFKPNKIAVERPIKDFQEINNRYREYYLDNYKLRDNEEEQIGFRIAKILNHPKIYPIDVQAFLPFEPLIDYMKNDDIKMYEEFQKKTVEMGETMNHLQKNATVLENLRYYNDTERMEKEHSELYLDFNKIGAGDNYCGANFLSAWYDRNIRIFGNLQSIAESEDRILVIYGAGHLKILSEFIESYLEMELIGTNQYLQ